jgi:multiple sugar transport system substrate-binding protein
MYHKQLKIIIVVLLIISLFSVILSGCNQNKANILNPAGSSGNVTDSGAKNPVILDFYIWDDEESYITPVVDAYNALNTAVQVQLHVLSSATYDKEIKADLNSNIKIDLLGIHGISSMVQIKDMGKLLDLTSYIATNDMDVTAYGSMFNDIAVDGKYYGIPTRSTCWFLLYNKDLFDDVGISYPGQMTWEEYRQLAKKLTRGEGDSKVYGGYWVPWCSNFEALQQSSYLIDDDLTLTRETLELLNDCYNVDESHVSFKIASDENTNYLEEFEKGYIAMMPQGEWIINMLLNDEAKGISDINWDIAPMPIVEGLDPGTTWGQYQFVSIAQKTAYPEEAFDFVQFLCGKEGARIYAQNSIIHAYSDDEIKQLYLETVGKPSASILFEAKRVQEQLAVSGYEEINDVFKDDIAKKYLNGEITLDEAMADFEKKRDQILNP